jgi:hypothetical protein
MVRASTTRVVLVFLTLVAALAQLAHLTRVPVSANHGSHRQPAFQKAVLSESVSVRASGRGNPWVNMGDGRGVLTAYEGPEELTSALEQNSGQPLSLASADFDEDGVPDLISGYAGPRSGIVTMLRGDVDSLFPNAPEAQRRKAEGDFTDSPFLSPARVFELPESPDFIGAGDFDADGHWDVVAAARGSNLLYRLSGDGRGNFAPPAAINLAGAVTTLTTGEINRADGLEDVIVGITAADGAKVLVFEGPDGALKAAPESFALPGEAVSLALGQLTGDYWMDLAVAAGNDLLIITGRDRKLSLDETSRAGVPQATITQRSFSSALKSVAAGNFTGDFKTDLALLFEDGTVQVLSRAKEQPQSIKSWKVDRAVSGSWQNAKQLIRAKVSTLPHDDLVIPDSAGHRLQILAGTSESDSRSRGMIATASLEAASEPVAMLPMRLNSDALSDLVILEAGHIAPTASFTIASATVTVDSNTDVDDGDTTSIANLMSSKGVDGMISLREAITAANNTPGADTINFSIGSGAQTISLGSALPTISDPVTIDGTTQPGFAGSPIIELNGSGAGAGAAGLRFTGGSSTVRGLVINLFLADGVKIETTGGNLIEGCFIGTDAASTGYLGNLNGVFIDGASTNTIGGTATGARNVISGNSQAGVTIQGGPAMGNKVQGNFIGTDATGTFDVGNSAYGVFITATNNLTGGTSAGAGNTISGNNQDGVLIFAGGTGNQVLGNFIGTNVSGTVALANNNTGVLMSDAPSNTIGGTSPGARNVISGNGFYGVDVFSFGSTGNLVQGNIIGTNITGSAPLANSFDGVVIEDASGNTIGGVSSGARNIISGNSGSGQNGVRIASANGNQVLGNFIGTNVDGTVGLGNGGNGVLIDNSNNNTIGGTAAGAGNVISGNLTRGVEIIKSGVNPPTLNQVLGNFIGTDVNGIAKIPNLTGVRIVGNDNTIGGAAAGARNVISGNSANGIWLDTGAMNNHVLGNIIGRDVNGTGAHNLGNGVGILIFGSSGNNIGGTAAGEANLIASNNNAGIEIFGNSATGNRILENSIGLNAGLGIDLGADGKTPNDAGDADTGPNNLQNSPELTMATSSGGTTNVHGAFNSIASTNFRIEFFRNDFCQGEGSGPGITFIGAGSVTTDGSGNATLNEFFSVSISPGQTVTATATNSATNDTSELSNCVAVAPSPCAIACPANITRSADTGQCSAIVNYQVPAASASCGPVTCSPPSSAFFLTGITTVTCSTSGGPGCSFSVTVNDNQAPVITCPSNVTAALPPTDSAVRVNYPAPAATDNCSATAVCSPPSGSFFPAGVTTVTCTATDTSSNTTNCSFTVTAASTVISINDASVVEGNSGTSDAVFTITLSKAAALPVTINFATSDGSAKAGSDYFSNSGTLTFDPGQLSKSVSVRVIGDTSREPDETFFVNLSGATNAAISDGQGTCTILNDDGPPALSISDVIVIEGNSGAVNAVFTVTLSPASGQTVTVNFATADDTATLANNDYVAASGTLTFTPGERGKLVEVLVIGDNSQEPDETFLVRLSSPVNADILDGIGVGTIINDESPLTADLSVSTSVANVISSGEQLAYTITINNAGPRLAAGIRLLDDVPSGCTLSSVRSSAGVLTAPSPGAPGSITWTLDSLAPGSEATLDLVINVLALAGDTLVNTASVRSLSPDPNAANDTSVTLTIVQGGGSVELVWEQTDSTPINPTPPPNNVRIAGGSLAATGFSATRIAPAANVCTLVEFKVYISPIRPVQVTPANLWKSSVPPDARKITLPALPAGTFYVVVAVWNCDGTDIDSPPSNEANAPPVPGVTKMVVKSQIKITGINFQSGLVITIDGVRFEDRAVIKRSGTLVIQRGKLTDGRSIQDVLGSGKTVLMVFRNPDGGMATILLPTLPSSP